MTLIAWIPLASGAATLCLDAYAVRKVYLSGLYEKSQLRAQTALILCLPLLGAFLAIYLCRDNIPVFQRPAADDVTDIDGTSSNVDYHG